jgi:fatty acid desaturase
MAKQFQKSKPTAAVEWPTLLLAVGIYGAWLLLTYYHRAIPIYLLVPLGAWTLAWHGSMQHELIHNHPTRNQRLNNALGFPPLVLWLPYDIYRNLHLTHHRDERLTDPLDDPESRYWTLESWQDLGWFGRLVLNAQSVLLGRLILGPAWSIVYFLVAETRRLLAGDWSHLRIWIAHGLGVAAVVIWLKAVCGFSLLAYIFCFVYPATALLQIRSFAEHRAAAQSAHRTAIVENSPILGLLFLYNNLHIAHHTFPQIPWYALPGYYRRHRTAFIKRNGGLLYQGYDDVFRRFLLKPHDGRLHPFDRVPHDLPAERPASAEVLASASVI